MGEFATTTDREDAVSAREKAGHKKAAPRGGRGKRGGAYPTDWRNVPAVIDGTVLDALRAADRHDVEVTPERLAARLRSACCDRSLDERDAAASIARLVACELVEVDLLGRVSMTPHALASAVSSRRVQR